MSTHQHSSLTAAQKCTLCETKKKNPNLIYNKLAKLYQIGRSTPKLEEALSLWVDNALAMYQDIDGNILKEKAKFFAEELNIDSFSQSEEEEMYNQNDIEEILKDDEDELENLIAQLSETDLLNACEYICVENMEIEVSCTKAEIALDTILKFLYEQYEEFGEVEEDTKILRRLHRQ
ncbi:18187_t:CDS:2, partial [Cetraspora pellucida]